MAGGGGRVAKLHTMSGMEWLQWLPDPKPADGPGPDARFGRITSLALANGKLYLIDDSLSLRTIEGRLDLYSADEGVVLQPIPDDLRFWAPEAGRFRPEAVRLGVALYGPAEAVGLLVDGQLVAEAHHPLYTLRWDATQGEHRLTPLLRRPDGTWEQSATRSVTVADDGISTNRSGLVLPRNQSWVRGTVAVTAISDWQEAEIRVDGKRLARGTGLIAAEWDTTGVTDGFQRDGKARYL